MSIGENIQRYRKERNLSQEELGQKLLVSRQTVSLWETDQTAPTLENLMRLKEIFGVSIDEILNGEQKAETAKNKNSLDTVCASLAYAMGIEPPAFAAAPNWELTNYIDKVFDGQKADRIVMYNPDAIAQWIYQKYTPYFDDTVKRTDIEIPLAAAMPSVTPVCFGTMYTGAQPSVHGIRKYEKPVIRIDSLFDALIRAGKKPVIVAKANCSLAHIFCEREMDYFIYSTIEEINAKAAELILRDEYDFIVVYNGNFDARMHKTGPEAPEALGELRANVHAFSMFASMIKTHWKQHNTLLGFAMDHGCHEIDGGCGSHGLDMDEDINIVHLYRAYPASE